MPTCPNHPDTELICPKCRAGELGRMTSAKKQASSRRNGRKHKADPRIAKIMAERGVTRQRAHVILKKKLGG